MELQPVPKADRVIDARGSFCPGPLMALIGAVREGKPGDVLEVWSTDAGSKRDIPFWAVKAKHELIGVFDTPTYARIVVRKLR